MTDTPNTPYSFKEILSTMQRMVQVVIAAKQVDPDTSTIDTSDETALFQEIYSYNFDSVLYYNHVPLTAQNGHDFLNLIDTTEGDERSLLITNFVLSLPLFLSAEDAEFNAKLPIPKPYLAPRLLRLCHNTDDMKLMMIGFGHLCDTQEFYLEKIPGKDARRTVIQNFSKPDNRNSAAYVGSCLAKEFARATKDDLDLAELHTLAKTTEARVARTVLLNDLAANTIDQTTYRQFSTSCVSNVIPYAN